MFYNENKTVDASAFMQKIRKIPSKLLKITTTIKKIADDIPDNEEHLYTAVILSQVFLELKMEAESLVWL